MRQYYRDDTSESESFKYKIKIAGKVSAAWNTKNVKIAVPLKYLLIDGKSFFDQPVKNDMRTYDNIQKISPDQGDYFTTGCLLDYKYFRKHYKKIALNLSKQKELDSDPKAVQQINFTENLDTAEGSTMFFIIEEAKETVLDFS